MLAVAGHAIGFPRFLNRPEMRTLLELSQGGTVTALPSAEIGNFRLLRSPDKLELFTFRELLIIDVRISSMAYVALISLQGVNAPLPLGNDESELPRELLMALHAGISLHRFYGGRN